jgi:hypothetical protein
MIEPLAVIAHRQVRARLDLVLARSKLWPRTRCGHLRARDEEPIARQSLLIMAFKCIDLSMTLTND